MSCDFHCTSGGNLSLSRDSLHRSQKSSHLGPVGTAPRDIWCSPRFLLASPFDPVICRRSSYFSALRPSRRISRLGCAFLPAPPPVSPSPTRDSDDEATARRISAAHETRYPSQQRNEIKKDPKQPPLVYAAKLFTEEYDGTILAITTKRTERESDRKGDRAERGKIPRRWKRAVR